MVEYVPYLESRVFGFVTQRKVSARADAAMRLGLMCVAVFAGGLALRNIGAEFLAHKTSVDGALGLYRAVEDDLTRRVWSTEGTYGKLLACDAALTDLTLRLQPKSKRVEVAQSCLAMADAVLQISPGFSLAYVVKAQALQEQGELTEMRSALLLAEATGGSNVQYAQRRAEMWINQISALNADEQAALRREIERMAVTDIGVTWVAGQYAAHVNLRPFIAMAVEALSEERQTVFLSKVRTFLK